MKGRFVPGCTFTTGKVNCHKADESDSFVCVCVYASAREHACVRAHTLPSLVDMRNDHVAF